MQRVTKIGLCLVAILALLAVVGCGKKKPRIKAEDKAVELYPADTMFQTEQWVQQSLANTLAP